MQKPAIPRGTRDFSPHEMVRRNFIFDTIRKVYQRYGFEQIETPSMENLNVLEGKYGEEGDKLLFRVLNSGNILEDFREKEKELKLSSLTEKGLRYDLTVPFARYVVMHQNEISFPFRRYQIQPVWRADRPAKARYREFYQCDADIIGSNSLLNEAELLSIIADVFSELKLEVIIKINNRKILAGIAEKINAPDKIVELTVAIDKLDKIGLEKVTEELIAKGFSDESIKKLQPVFELNVSADSKLEKLKNFLSDSATGLKGIEETTFILKTFTVLFPDKNIVEPDITLARGLNYYTGAIIEVKVNDTRTGISSSICGGGRYDDLTGIFGLPGVSGVGISFGADRIYDVLEELKGFPDFSTVSTQLLFLNFGSDEALYCIGLAHTLRLQGINTEIYPDAAKIKKQMSYADTKKIPYVALVGSEEIKNTLITLKNMETGNQEKLNPDELANFLRASK
jgi:histidyl-tRNA synthetase